MSFAAYSQSSISSFLGLQASDLLLVYSSISGMHPAEVIGDVVVQRGHLTIEDAHSLDFDQDGVLFVYDQCPNTNPSDWVDVYGCPQQLLNAEAFTVQTNGLSCVGSGDGSIRIESTDHQMEFDVLLNDVVMGTLNPANNWSFELTGQASGSYTLCIAPSDPSYQNRCYEVKLDGPDPIEVEAIEDLIRRTLQLEMKGSSTYTMIHNGKKSKVQSDQAQIALSPGLNTITVEGELPCQGTYAMSYFVSEEVRMYPNPTQGPLTIYAGGTDTTLTLRLRNKAGLVLQERLISVPQNREIPLDFSGFSEGLYFVEIQGETTRVTQKLIRQ